MKSVSRIISPLLLCLHILLVWGGPVLAHYCCGQRVPLEAVCAPESCCSVAEQCCDEVLARESDPCCTDGGEFELEFTYVGSLDAAVSPTSAPNLIPSVALGDQVQYRDLALTVRVTVGIEPTSVPYEPPDLQLLGVLRL